MSKIEKDIRKYINNNLDHTDQYEKIASLANVQKRKEEKRVNIMKKSWLKFVVPCAIALVLVLAAVIIIGANNGKKQEGKAPAAVIQMDVNPSISFVVDENQVVLSVYGENDEGKMIVSGEEFVGLALDKAIEKVIEIETKTGYLVKNAENQIKFVIESDKEELLNKLETKVKEKTTEVCEKYNIKEKVTLVKEKAHDELVKRALDIDPTLSTDVANKMTSEELLKYILGSQLEKATIPTVELEKFYDQVKENKISFASKEETKKAVDALDSAYQSFKSNYADMLVSLKEASDKLNELYYEQFVSASSNYNMALDEIKKAKMELLKLKEELTTLPEGNINHSLKKAEIIAKENAIVLLEKTLDAAKEAAEVLIEAADKALDQIILNMENSLNELPTEVKTSLNSSLSNLETKLNEVKDAAFEEFETNYKDDIEAAYKKISEYKASLVAQLK